MVVVMHIYTIVLSSIYLFLHASILYTLRASTIPSRRHSLFAVDIALLLFTLTVVPPPSCLLVPPL